MGKTNRATGVAMAAVGLLLTYGLVSLAIDTGSILQYLGAIIVFVLSIRLAKRTIITKK